MIPKWLHQIWIGPRPAPDRWIDTWRQLNADFEHRLWDDAAIEALGLRNDAVYRRFVSAGIYDGAADVARVEILYRCGGVYVDADSVALRPIRDAGFMQAGFFAQHEASDKHPGLITNAFMGAVAGHGVLTRYIEAISHVVELRPMWRLTGPRALTEVLEAEREQDVMVLPAWTFFTTSLDGEEQLGGQPYARHFWSTTAERWGRTTATPYPDEPGHDPYEER